MLHHVTACEAVCAALQDGQGSNSYAHVTTAAQKEAANTMGSVLLNAV